MDEIRRLCITGLIVAGCAARAAAPGSTPFAAVVAPSARPHPNAVPPSAPVSAPENARLELRLAPGLDASWGDVGSLGELVTLQHAPSQVPDLGELYDDPQARLAYTKQPFGITIGGQPGALLLLARFGAWWQGGELSEPVPLSSVRIASFQGLDAEQARAVVRLFVETHVHETRLWRSDPMRLASALAAAKTVVEDARVSGDCRAPCVPWPWQTRWSVLEISGRAAWREGDNTRDAQLLDAAIARIREARRAIPEAHPLTAAVTERLLGAALQSRAEVAPDLRGAEDALAASRRALAAFGNSDLRADWGFTNSNIQEQLRVLARRDGSLARYDEALAISDRVLQVLASPKSPLAQAWARLLRADTLEDKYEAFGDRQALSAAKEQLSQALTLLSPAASPLLEQRLYGASCSVFSELGAITADVSQLEQGVQACERALALAPEVEEPRAALLVRYGLALARLGDARSDVGLLRQAVTHIQTALASLDPHTQPASRARALNNLAGALRALSNREEQSKNLALSDAAYEESLALLPKQVDPISWAKIMLGRAETERRLGWIERSRLRMDAAKAHYERALRAIDGALTAINEKNEPALWASAQERAGDVLAREGEIAEGFHFNQAVARYQLALRVNRRASDPTAYAATQFGLGVAYLFWADQSMGLNHIRSIAKKSVAAFRDALAIQTQVGLRHAAADTKAHLADAISIVDRVSYRSTCEPEALLAEAVQEDARAAGLWESAAASLERYQRSPGANKCGLGGASIPPSHE